MLPCDEALLPPSPGLLATLVPKYEEHGAGFTFCYINMNEQGRVYQRVFEEVPGSKRFYSWGHWLLSPQDVSSTEVNFQILQTLNCHNKLFEWLLIKPSPIRKQPASLKGSEYGPDLYPGMSDPKYVPFLFHQ